MPVQCLIRKLTRAQVDAQVTSWSMQDRLAIQDHNGSMLLVVVGNGEVADPEANAALQAIAEADSDLIHKERKVIEAAEAKAAKDAALAAAKAKNP